MTEGESSDVNPFIDCSSKGHCSQSPHTVTCGPSKQSAGEGADQERMFPQLSLNQDSSRRVHVRKPGCLHAPSGSVHFTDIAHLNAWWRRTGQVKGANEAAKAK